MDIKITVEPCDNKDDGFFWQLTLQGNVLCDGFAATEYEAWTDAREHNQPTKAKTVKDMSNSKATTAPPAMAICLEVNRATNESRRLMGYSLSSSSSEISKGNGSPMTSA